MAKKKRREEIVDFIFEQINSNKLISLKIRKDQLIAETCLQFSCGERLVKEIIKHLELVGKIDFNQLELNSEVKP